MAEKTVKCSAALHPDGKRLKSTRLVRRAVVALTAVGAAALVLALPAAGLQAPTTLATPSGKLILKVEPMQRYWWVYGHSEECSVNFFRGGYDLWFLHGVLGSALPAGKSRWAVWRGERFRGYIHLVNRTYATITKRGGGGRVIATARGPDPIAAGAGYLVIGPDC